MDNLETVLSLVLSGLLILFIIFKNKKNLDFVYYMTALTLIFLVSKMSDYRFLIIMLISFMCSEFGSRKINRKQMVSSDKYKKNVRLMVVGTFITSPAICFLISKQEFSERFIQESLNSSYSENSMVGVLLIVIIFIMSIGKRKV